MNRATFIETLAEVQRNVQQLLDQLQASEADKFVARTSTKLESSTG